MRPWFQTKNGNWMPVYDEDGYHPEWIEAELEFTPEEIKKHHEHSVEYAQEYGGTPSSWYKSELNFLYERSQRKTTMPD